MKNLSLPRPEAVIFDFDGILVDSEPMHYRAFTEVLDPLGMGFPWKEYVEIYMGFDDRDAFREAFRAKGVALDDANLANLVAAIQTAHEGFLQDLFGQRAIADAPLDEAPELAVVGQQGIEGGL